MKYVVNNLSPGEQVIYQTNVHWIYLVGAWIALILMGWFIVGIVIFAIMMVNYHTTEIAVTSSRLIYKRGWIARRVDEIRLSRIESCVIAQSVVGRLLGFGDIIVRGTGVGDITLRDVDAPLALRSAIDYARSGTARVRPADRSQQESYEPRLTSTYHDNDRKPVAPLFSDPHRIRRGESAAEQGGVSGLKVAALIVGASIIVWLGAELRGLVMTPAVETLATSSREHSSAEPAGTLKPQATTVQSSHPEQIQSGSDVQWKPIPIKDWMLYLPPGYERLKPDLVRAAKYVALNRNCRSIDNAALAPSRTEQRGYPVFFVSCEFPDGRYWNVFVTVRGTQVTELELLGPGASAK